MHWQRWYKTGDVGPAESTVKPAKGLRCTVEGCERPRHAMGLCNLHRQRLRLKGAVGTAGSRQTGFPHLDRRGYMVVYDPERSGTYGVHRLVMEASIGRRLDRHENVHHKNRDRSDNRLENLELWVTAQPAGGRVTDIIADLVNRYPEMVEAVIKQRKLEQRRIDSEGGPGNSR